MKLHRLTRTIHIGPCGLRLGRLEIEPSPYTGRVFILWFRRRRTNLVTSIPYRKAKVPPTYITRTVYQELPQVDRDLDPDIAYAVATMLDTFTTYLNAFLARDRSTDYDPPDYKPNNFLDAPYGWTHIKAIFGDAYTTTYALHVDDGDDGGGSELVGWFNWGNLEYMTHEFDTMLALAVNEGEIVYHETFHKEPQ